MEDVATSAPIRWERNIGYQSVQSFEEKKQQTELGVNSPKDRKCTAGKGDREQQLACSWQMPPYAFIRLDEGLDDTLIKVLMSYLEGIKLALGHRVN